MAECFGYNPREVDELNIRDLAVMLHAGLRKQRTGFQQAALIASKVHNLGGPRGKQFDPKTPVDLYPDLFPEGETGEEWEEEVKQAFEEYDPD